ncbi:MAG: hypothetical protein Q7K65_05610 [Candidatus Buchananbacteria bacterium]|nr:hypothetical protein [Candidatus Buchananbacteria bacterium]
MLAKSLVINGTIMIYEIDGLLSYLKELVLSAQSVQTNAQAPYSGFKVGAAVLDIHGHVSLGVNVERCTYTQTTHAEQNAIDSLVAQHGPVAIEVIAICGINQPRKINRYNISLNDIIFPCGHCLQIIWENCSNKNTAIISDLGDNLVAMSDIGSLLPVRFGPNNLNLNVFEPRRA